MLSTSPVRTALLVSVLSVAALSATGISNPEDEARVRATGSCPGCDLKGASLQGLVATGGDLTNADFANAVLYMATLKDANLTGAAFNGADLSGAILAGATGANLEGAITNDKTTCPDGSRGPCQ